MFFKAAPYWPRFHPPPSCRKMSIFAYQALKGLQLTERSVVELMAKLETRSFDIGDDIGEAGGTGLHLICDGLVMSSLSNG